MCETQDDPVNLSLTINNSYFVNENPPVVESDKLSITINDMRCKCSYHYLCRPSANSTVRDTIFIYLHLNMDVKLFDTVSAIFAVFYLDEVKDLQIVSFSAAKKRWCWEHYIKKDSDFMNKLGNADLTIQCSLNFDEYQKIQTKFFQSESKISRNDLSKDMTLLFGNQEFSDVTVSVKNKHFQVHKNVLSARSPVFASMFRHNMKEIKRNRVIIEDVNEDVMYEILRYIYTGKCHNLDKYAEELLAAADKFALDILKKICGEELVKTLSVENAVNMLVLADQRGATELKIKVIKFIVDNFSEVSKTTDWNQMSNPQLIREICVAFARR